MKSANIAIVIPVRRDTAAIRNLLLRIRSWAYQPAEVVVVSAESSNEVQVLCTETQSTYLEAPSCRGAQLHCGAEQTFSETLWFLHADSEPHEDSLEEIAKIVAADANGGYFRFTFSGPRTWWKSLLAVLINLRAKLGGMPYGDQGIFVRRDAYFDAGGFALQPLFEEVTLVKNLRNRGHFAALELPIGVATRRWENDGWWYRSVTNRTLALRYLFGVPVEELAKKYESRHFSNETNP
jgi:rSAM/selenodomain-associated transferase 2